MQATDLPINYNAVEILEHNLAARGEKEALFSDSRILTFSQISAEANRVANALKTCGVRPGEYVGLLAFDSPEWVTSFFGTLKIGAIHIGMNTLLTPSEYDYILKDSRARVLIMSGALWEKIEPIREANPQLETHHCDR